MALAVHEQVETWPIDRVIWRDDLYPRIRPDAATIQRYAQDLDVLPPIEVNQHGVLIDGYHRWTAHRKQQAETIKVIVTQTSSDAETYALAIQRNAAHGLQLNEEDKRSAAIRLYNAGAGLAKADIAQTLSVSVRTVNTYLKQIDDDLKAQRKQRIFDLWLACHTQEEIAEAVGVTQKTVDNHLAELVNLESLPNLLKLSALFLDAEWSPPLYNIWSFGRKSNAVSHFGNSEQRILENLLYLYTEPFDIVVDPFAGGGSTIDVCRKRLRRYWVSDRKPAVEREGEIRQLDITAELPPLHNRWSEVTLTYLDPPYWRQAAGQYSDDPADLANMSLEAFSQTLAGVVNGIAAKQSRGVIALLLQPTQWRADDRQFTDHVFDIMRLADPRRLRLEYRVSCPYQTEQYNAQQVEWAKANKQLLVLTRELVIWRVCG